ncbi:MAG TPA: homoserine kinase [Dehalococcoidia bacterium]|nr:homoserine kinase [Dehalococcoidia bacterium]
MSAREVTVRVPATSANLGPGFDCLGLALALFARVTLREAPGPEPDAAGAMMLAAARAAYRAAGRTPPDLSASWDGDIPVARGLGASAAFRVGAAVAANVLMGRPLDDDALLDLTAGLEGHGDNVAPALFGGLRVVVREGKRFRSLGSPLAPGLRLALFVPDFEMPTDESRKALPAALSREDAVHNIGRAALLVAALATGAWDALGPATEDRLHQPARAGIFPALPTILSAAREAGAHGAYLSGGGSTVAAFVTSGADAVARAMAEAAAGEGVSGRTIVTEPSPVGALVV